MKKLLISGSLVALCVPAAVHAQDSESGPYVGLSGGYVIPGDSENSGEFDTTVPATDDWPEIAEGTDLAWESDFADGYAISGQIGYAFENGFRVELEGSYTDYDVDSHRELAVGGADIDGLDVAVLTRTAPDAANPTVGEVIADAEGSVKNFGLFGNVLYDVQTGNRFKPYVGAGLGYQWVDVDYSPSDVGIADDDDGAFSYQLIAGAGFEVTERVDLFAQYTYRDTFEDADVELDLLPATLGVESQQSILSAGVRFQLGG